MNVILDTKVELDADKVAKLMLRKASRALVRAGSYVRKVARTGIKRSPDSSRPGEPPHTRRGVLKRAIMYGMDDDRKSMYVGPSFSEMGVIGGLHERGGRRATPKKPRVYKQGQMGPISEDGGGWRTSDLPHARLESAAMVRRANELAEKYTRKVERAKYPPRPFIGPALEKSRDKIMEFFNDPKP